MNNHTSADEARWVITVLGLIFITLKLCHVINWSWWWVLLPFWGGLAIAAVGFVIVMVGLLIGKAFDR